MKTFFRVIVIAGIGAISAGQLSVTEKEKASNTTHAPGPATTKHGSDSTRASAAQEAAALSPVSTADVSPEAHAEAKRRHIRPVDDRLRIETPPPAAQEEKKPAAPAANYVWRPGHWAAANGEWQWMAGEWTLPPTSISVWIEGRYDVKERRWSPGYWQPDRVTPPDLEASSKNPTAPAPY